MNTSRPPRDGRHPILIAASTAGRPIVKLLRMSAWFVAAWSVIGWYHPPHAMANPPGVVVDSAFGTLAMEASPAPEALGKSGELRLATAMPGEHVDYPITLPHDTLSLRYAWQRVGDSRLDDSVRQFDGDTLVAPEQPGFYRLALLHGADEHVVDGLTLAVMVPFDEKHGAVLDGYKMGLYRSERHRADSSDRPIGFVKVTEDEIDLPVSAHLTLGDFLSRDGQDTWPRYAAIDPRVFDKLELVLERISRSLGRVTGDVPVELDLHSGFRTPAYNRHVPRAARDSRHQFGDALDIAIDADGNGRIDRHDAKLVAAAVDSVEAEYPDLVGGMGVYTSHRYRHPYVHIDVRGRRVRWHG